MLERAAGFGAVTSVSDLKKKKKSKNCAIEMLQNNILGAKNFNFFGFFNVGLKCFEGKA